MSFFINTYKLAAKWETSILVRSKAKMNNDILISHLGHEPEGMHFVAYFKMDM